MASTLSVLFTLALIGSIFAAPVEKAETTTEGDDGVTVYEVIEVIDEVPEVVALVEATEPPTTEAAKHKVSKRSLRSDNPNNDLLANLDGLNYEYGLNSLEGRRIKFLPTWVG